MSATVSLRSELLEWITRKIPLIHFAVRARNQVDPVKVQESCEICKEGCIACVRLNSRTEDDPYWLYLHVCSNPECRDSTKQQEGVEFQCPHCTEQAKEEDLE
jgi:hypothetical protein